MYIQSNANITSINSSKYISAHNSVPRLNPPQTNLPPASSETVTISSEARQLAQFETNAEDKTESTQLPSVPNMPQFEGNLEKYVAFQEARMKYRVVSDMTNIAMGSSEGISAPTAYYLSHNEDARAMTVNHLAQQQQVNTMQIYAETSKNINEWA